MVSEIKYIESIEIDEGIEYVRKMNNKTKQRDVDVEMSHV